MNNAEMINEYLEWRNNKANNIRYYGEMELSPEHWIKETIMSEAADRINLIKDLLESDVELDPVELANKIHSLVYDPLEELIETETGLGNQVAEDIPEEV